MGLAFEFAAVDLDDTMAEGAMHDFARLGCMANWLRPCSQLARLELDSELDSHVHEVIAMLGAAVGPQLQYLSLGRPLLPASPAEAARTLYALPLCFPNLGEPELSVRGPTETSGGGDLFGGAALALLQPLDVLLPRCHALSSFYVRFLIDINDEHPILESGQVEACCKALVAAHPGKAVSHRLVF